MSGYHLNLATCCGLLVLVASAYSSVLPLHGYSYLGGAGEGLILPGLVASGPILSVPGGVIHTPAFLVKTAEPVAPEAAKPEVSSAAASPAAPEPASPAAPEPASPAVPEAASPAAPEAASPAAPEAASETLAAPVDSSAYEPVKETPEVAAARAEHLAALQEAKARDDGSSSADEVTTAEPTETPETPETPEQTEPAPVSTPAPSAPLPPPVIASAPVPLDAAPVHLAPAPVPLGLTQLAVPAPLAVPAVLPSASQFRVQDELGQFAFGHVGGPNSREEVKTADGITRGSYAYIDGNGLTQAAAYISDPVNGFRVSATNLPAAPAPTYIADSPQVALAKAAHLKAVQEHIAKLQS